jgi:hypothetical protein
MLVLRQAGPLHPLDLPATFPHVREVASLGPSSRDPFTAEEGRDNYPHSIRRPDLERYRGVGGLHPPADSIAPGVSSGSSHRSPVPVRLRP